MPLLLKLARPLDSTTIAAIRTIARASGQLGLQALLVGATARIILLEHASGLSAGRATRDLDFAFALATWKQFDRLRQHLVSQLGFENDPKAAHRFSYHLPGMPYPIAIDLVPYGGVGGDQEELCWPPDMAVVMNVAGFKDAFASAIDAELEPGLVVRIASLPALALLKLFAWADRGRVDRKDAIDLVNLMHQYHEADADERVFSLPPEILESVGYDIELAGAWMLGNDVRMQASPLSLQRAKALLDAPKEAQRLISDMSRGLSSQVNSEAHAHQLLMQFWAGLRMN